MQGVRESTHVTTTLEQRHTPHYIIYSRIQYNNIRLSIAAYKVGDMKGQTLQASKAANARSLL
jgi:hypothetical protein